MSEMVDLAQSDAKAPDAEAQIAASSIATLLVDPQLNIRSVNPAAEVLLGQSGKRLKGQSVMDLLGFEDSRIADRLAKDSAQLMVRNISVPSGQKMTRCNFVASPLVAHDGWRVVTLSEAPLAEDRSDDGRSALRAPAVLAHEIKNPLSAIRGAGQLLARNLSAKERPLAQLISDEVDRIAGLVDRMQRLGSEMANPVAPANLHEAIRKALATIRAVDAAGPELREAFDPSLPAVLADRETLEQVLINLIANAREACADRDEPLVTVRTRFVAGVSYNNRTSGKSLALPIEITVTDNGPGVDAAIAEQIFDPFVSSKKNGQGLGLALVRKLLTDMNGRISHDRDEQAGLTNFRVRLPVAN